MGISHKTFNLVSTDGTVLRGRYWKPDNYPLATVCLVHGIGDHSARYDAWARCFCKQGMMVYAVDYRGHGESEGKRGPASQLSDLLDDIGALVRRCKRNYGDIPGFIFGHSMGGTLVLNYLVRRRQDFAGAIVSSPWIELVNPPKSFLLKIGKWANGFLPEYLLSTGVKSWQMSNDPKRIEESDNDPLLHGKISLRLFNEIFKASEDISTFKASLKIHLLLLHGTGDGVTRCEASKKLADFNPLKFSFIGYKDALHELHNQPNVTDIVFKDIMSWIKPKIK
jgi:acylglycerol lipase